MQESLENAVSLVKKGNQEAFARIAGQFEKVIRITVSSCNADTERDDLCQEGLIGLYKACLAYNPTLGASFSTFARICIKHSILSALRVYYGNKNYPIRSSLSLDASDGNSMEIQGLGPVTEPERLLIEKESYNILLDKIDASLSEFEGSVLKLFVQGKTYTQISESLNVTPKSVDNAIQRIRGKLKLFI